MFRKRRQNKDFRVFCFTIFNAIVAFISTQLAGIQGEGAVIVVGLAIPLLNIITKYANKKWFGDLGVLKNVKAE